MKTLPPTRSTLRTSGLLLTLLGALLLLHGPLATGLPLPDRSQLASWLADDPAVTLATGLRAAAIAMAWYLVAITVLQLLLHLAGLRSTLLDSVTPALVRQLLGASLVIATVSQSAIPSAWANQGEAPPVTMVRLAETTPVTQPADDETMTMTRLGPVDVSDISDVAEQAATQVQEQMVVESSHATTWRVGDGEHFWHIAEQTLSERLGRTPTSSEIDPFWREIVELNRARLIDPANPNLVVAGQVFELPQ